MKTKEELNALKGKGKTVNRKLHELTEEELEEVTGGGHLDPSDCVITYDGSITSSPDVGYSSDVWKMHIR